MIAVDTNVLVRLLTGDDPAQTRLAADLFAQESIFIPKTVLLETEWVLRYSYELSPTVILTAYRKLLGLPQVAVEDNNALVEALARYEEGMDFAAALHLASMGEADQFATFDARLKKRAGTQVKVRLL